MLWQHFEQVNLDKSCAYFLGDPLKWLGHPTYGRELRITVVDSGNITTHVHTPRSQPYSSFCEGI